MSPAWPNPPMAPLVPYTGTWLGTGLHGLTWHQQWHPMG